MVPALRYVWEAPNHQPFGGESRWAIAHDMMRESRMQGPDAARVLRMLRDADRTNLPLQGGWRARVRAGERQWWIDEFGFVDSKEGRARLGRKAFLAFNRTFFVLSAKVTMKMNTPEMAETIRPTAARIRTAEARWRKVYDSYPAPRPARRAKLSTTPASVVGTAVVTNGTRVKEGANVRRNENAIMVELGAGSRVKY